MANSIISRIISQSNGYSWHMFIYKKIFCHIDLVNEWSCNCFRLVRPKLCTWDHSICFIVWVDKLHFDVANMLSCSSFLSVNTDLKFEFMSMSFIKKNCQINTFITFYAQRKRSSGKLNCILMWILGHWSTFDAHSDRFHEEHLTLPSFDFECKRSVTVNQIHCWSH